MGERLESGRSQMAKARKSGAVDGLRKSNANPFALPLARRAKWCLRILKRKVLVRMTSRSDAPARRVIFLKSKIDLESRRQAAPQWSDQKRTATLARSRWSGTT